MTERAAPVAPEPAASGPKDTAVASVRVFFLAVVIAIIAAEATIAYGDPLTGAAIDALIVAVLAGHRYIFAPGGVRSPSPPVTLAALALSLLPILRLLSLTLPVKRLAEITWYEMVGAPLLVVLVLLSRMDADLGRLVRARGRAGVQALVAVAGVPLGLLGYQIAKPEPLATGSDALNFLLGPLILIVFSGLTEELLFRGAVAVALDRIGGAPMAIACPALLFAAFHVDLGHAGYVPFAAAYGLAFGLVVRRTGALWGVALAHGLLNVGVIIVWPNLL